MKISFDFDNTLEHQEVQDLAEEMIKAGHDVCILTTRYSDPTNYSWARHDPEAAKDLNNELFEIATRLGIKEVNFTEYQWKTTVIDALNIDIHIDDNLSDKVEVINKNNKAKAVLYEFGGIKATRDDLFDLISQLEKS